MPRPRRDCQVCAREFQPRSEARHQPDTICPSCRKNREVAAEQNESLAATGRDATFRPFQTPVPSAETHSLASPMRQVVFDLETFSLTRDWGVTMVAVLLVHGGANGAEWYVLRADEQQAWREGRRSDDRELVTQILQVLQGCHIAYAHNGANFDIRWLRTAALKYRLKFPPLKLVDPAKVAWAKYGLGRNSLSALANYLELDEEKMPVSQEVWRRALMDDSRPDFNILVERCKSDVRLLNEIASRVTGDVGLIDQRGSAW